MAHKPQIACTPPTDHRPLTTRTAHCPDPGAHWPRHPAGTSSHFIAGGPGGAAPPAGVVRGQAAPNSDLLVGQSSPTGSQEPARGRPPHNHHRFLLPPSCVWAHRWARTNDQSSQPPYCRGSTCSKGTRTSRFPARGHLSAGQAGVCACAPTKRLLARQAPADPHRNGY